MGFKAKVKMGVYSEYVSEEEFTQITREQLEANLRNAKGKSPYDTRGATLTKSVMVFAEIVQIED